MSGSVPETDPSSSATPEDSLQPGSSTQTTPQLNEEENNTWLEPEPVPSTSGICSKGKLPANPRSRACKKNRENWEDSIISAFEFINISGGVDEFDSSDDDDFWEGKEEKVEEREKEEVEEEVKEEEREEEENRRKKSNRFDYHRDESAILELSLDPGDTYPQVSDDEDEPQPGTSTGFIFSFPLETGTPENEQQQPVSEENITEEDAAALALASPPPHPLRISPLNGNVMSSVPFYNLKLPKETIRHLRNSLGITMATILQEKAIPVLLQEKDVFMHAGSGSGKTVAYAIPLVHRLLLIKPQVRREDGIRVMVVVPNRDCAKRTFETFATLVRPAPWIEVGKLGGGDYFRMEKETIRRSVTILITTPLRFLDHIRRTNTMFLKNLSCLVVDGIDEVFERGGQKHLMDIITVLDKGWDHLHQPEHISTYKKEHVEASRQTILVARTITQEVACFTGLNTTNPVMIDDRFNSPPRAISLPTSDPEDKKDGKLPPPLYKQYFMLVPERMKLVALVGFVMWKCKMEDEKKFLIFTGTQTIADYFSDLFHVAYGYLGPDRGKEFLASLDVYFLTPFLSHQDKADIFATFSSSEAAVLFCTDNSVKGVDLPRVDWVIHLMPPTCPSDYMARIGFPNPGFQIGSSLTMLLIGEKGYVQEMKTHDVVLSKMKVKQPFIHLWACYSSSMNVDDMILAMQTYIEEIVHRSPWLRDRACLAFASWCRLYSSYPQNLKHIFRFTGVGMDNYVHSFGLRDSAAFVISHARKLNSVLRRKPAKKRSAPAEDEELLLEPSAKMQFPSSPIPDLEDLVWARSLVATERGEVTDPGEPCTSGDQAGIRKRRNDEGMEQGEGEEECPEKRSK